MTSKTRRDYAGILMVGDPHLEGRVPGFRKDDYPEVILEKLAWCISHADSYGLLPVLLGDLFDKPRDNPTWMLGRLIDLFSDVDCIGVYGNHDCADPELSDNDSLTLLIKAGRVTLLSERDPWCGTIGGRSVIIGGSSYRRPIPKIFEPSTDAHEARPFVVWITHHDLSVPGYEGQRYLRPTEIQGIDLVVNGHIHRRLEDVCTGKTRWVTPGNIARRTRSDTSRQHTPEVLRVDIEENNYTLSYVEVPHKPFECVFHQATETDGVTDGESAFVTGLADLEMLRTQSGAGLKEFLEENIRQFPEQVSQEIMTLAREVMEDG